MAALGAGVLALGAFEWRVWRAQSDPLRRI